MDDDEAVRRTLAGDPDAYGILVARYSSIAHRTAYLLGAGEAAEDVVQEAFLKAFRALGSYRRDAPFKPWLLRIVANEAHNQHRSKLRRIRLVRREAAVLDSVAVVDGPEADAVANDRRAALLDAVRALPEKDRLVIVYRYFLDLSEPETAQALDWPRGTVKSRLSRALAKLRPVLATALDEERENVEIEGGDR